MSPFRSRSWVAKLTADGARATGLQAMPQGHATCRRPQTGTVNQPQATGCMSTCCMPRAVCRRPAGTQAAGTQLWLPPLRNEKSPKYRDSLMAKPYATALRHSLMSPLREVMVRNIATALCQSLMLQPYVKALCYSLMSKPYVTSLRSRGPKYRDSCASAYSWRSSLSPPTAAFRTCQTWPALVRRRAHSKHGKRA